MRRRRNKVLTTHTDCGNAHPLTFWRWISSLSWLSGLSTFIWDDFQSRTAKRTVPTVLERFIRAQWFVLQG